MKRKFLVVIQDCWNIRDYRKAKLGRVGDVAKELALELGYDDVSNIDVKKLNSKRPYSAGTFGPCFYDIDVFNKDGDYATIMVFVIS